MSMQSVCTGSYAVYLYINVRSLLVHIPMQYVCADKHTYTALCLYLFADSVQSHIAKQKSSQVPMHTCFCLAKCNMYIHATNTVFV